MNESIRENTKRSTLLIGVLVSMSLLFLFPLLGKFILIQIYGIALNTPTAFWFSRVLFWICLLLVFLYAVKIEKQQLLIWEEKEYKFFTYLLSIIGIFLVLVTGLFFITKALVAAGFNPESENFNKMLHIFRNDKLLIIFTALTAGFVEELIFRGYLLPRLSILTKSPIIAILISSLLFGLMHYGFGTVFQIVGPFYIGLVFAFYYLEFRNIKVLIFCHCAWDLMAIFLRT